MDVFDKAKELGELIRESEEMKRLKDCEINLLSDTKARAMFDDYNLLQKELFNASKEGKSNDTIQEIEDKISKKEQEIYSNDIARSFLETKSGFDKLMKNINSVLVYSITGEETCSESKCKSCKSGCGGIH